MRVITNETVIGIMKHIISVAEETVTEEFINKYPRAIFPIGASTGLRTENQVMVSISFDQLKDYKFVDTTDKFQARLFFGADGKQQKLFIIDGKSSKLGELPIRNERLKKLIFGHFEVKDNGAYLSQNIREQIYNGNETWNTKNAFEEGFAEIIKQILSNTAFSSGLTDPMIIISVAGSGSWSYEQSEGQWKRIYGGEGPITISDEAEVITLGTEETSY